MSEETKPTLSSGKAMSIMAEAMNLWKETGLTPRELAEQRKELLAALKVAEIEIDRMQWGKRDFVTLRERLAMVRNAIDHCKGEKP
jgi:hypothetical protein